MTCSICTKTALRHVGSKGFCEAHTSAAFDAAKEDSNKHSSWQALGERRVK